MTGVVCRICGAVRLVSRNEPRCEQMGCPFDQTIEPMAHVTPNPDTCGHDFQGWRPFPDGNGGEQVCTKCGIGAMEYTLRVGP